MMNIYNKLQLTVFLTLYLVACEPSREYQTPEAPTGFTQTNLESLGNNRFQASKPVIEWWETLKDDQLNELVLKSFDQNKDIRIALANLFEARAIARKAGFDRYPTITSNGSFQRVRSTEVSTPSRADQINNNFDAGFDASWELDLFGRVSESIKSVDAQELVALANFRDVYISIAAEVARTYIELRGAQYRLDIAKRNTKNQTETFELTKSLAEGGRGTELDVARAEAQLESTKSIIPSRETEITSNIHRLSVLTGQVPEALREQLKGVKPLPNIPITVEVGNTSDLLRRRPDIVAAERQFAASVAQYNVSVADQFPRVSLLGSLGFTATKLDNFGASTFRGSLGPSVTWAAFDMGRVKAQIRQDDAKTQAALANYEKTVLEALEELQNAVSNFSNEEERRERLQKSTRSSFKAASIARMRYEAGVDSFLDTLSAEKVLLETEDALAQSEIKTALDLIAIYKALGGGWQVKKVD